jgi:NADH dehydrogenase/NADH:ubiquinone oxidoreductase subunit G
MTEEVFGTSALGFVNRGLASRVQPALGRPLAKVNDKGIEHIVEACPVGAFTLKSDPVPVLDPKFERPEIPALV